MTSIFSCAGEARQRGDSKRSDQADGRTNPERETAGGLPLGHGGGRPRNQPPPALLVDPRIHKSPALPSRVAAFPFSLPVRSNHNGSISERAQRHWFHHD